MRRSGCARLERRTRRRDMISRKEVRIAPRILGRNRGIHECSGWLARRSSSRARCQSRARCRDRVRGAALARLAGDFGRAAGAARAGTAAFCFGCRWKRRRYCLCRQLDAFLAMGIRGSARGRRMSGGCVAGAVWSGSGSRRGGGSTGPASVCLRMTTCVWFRVNNHECKNKLMN